MKVNIGKVTKVLTVVVPVVSAGLGLAANWLDDKKLDDKVAAKVTEAVANLTKTEES